MINPRILSITRDAHAAEDATDTPALRAAEAAQQDATVTLAVAPRRAVKRHATPSGLPRPFPVSAPGLFTRDAYLRAKVLDALSSDCHTQTRLFSSLGREEMSEVYEQAGAALHHMARQLFPHEHFAEGAAWARAEGFHE